MRRAFLVVAGAALLAAPFVAGAGGCSSVAGQGPIDASADYFGVRTPSDDGGAAADVADGEMPLAPTLRLVHLSPNLRSIDFCWRLSGTQTFYGPVLSPSQDAGTFDASTFVDASASGDAAAFDASDASDEDDADLGKADATADAAAPADGGGGASPADAGSPGLSFGSVTRDVSFPAAGTFDIALVPGGSPTCAQTLLVQQVTLDVGKQFTAAVMGLSGADAGTASALSILAFTDDRMVDPAHARVRLVHAALGLPGGTPAPSLGAMAGETVLATEIDPRHASNQSTVPNIDALGYAAVDPLSGSQIVRITSLGDTGSGDWTSLPVDLGLASGSVHAGYIVSAKNDGLGLVWCEEAAAPAAGTAPSCMIIDLP